MKYERKRALLLALSLLITGCVYGCGAGRAPSLPSEDERSAPEAQLASPEEPLVAIYLGDTLYAVYPLSKEDTIRIDQGDGKLNVVSITGSSVYMSHATCDNQDCVEQSAVTLENYNTRVLFGFIICLPNSVTVELIAGPEG